MRTLRSVQRGRVALVGDASGGVDAITGEGIRLGLRQASALAEAMAAGNLQQYEKAAPRARQASGAHGTANVVARSQSKAANARDTSSPEQAGSVFANAGSACRA